MAMIKKIETLAWRKSTAWFVPWTCKAMIYKGLFLDVFRKWWGGVEGRLEFFREFLRFGSLHEPTYSPTSAWMSIKCENIFVTNFFYSWCTWLCVFWRLFTFDFTFNTCMIFQLWFLASQKRFSSHLNSSILLHIPWAVLILRYEIRPILSHLWATFPYGFKFNITVGI